MNSNIKKLVIFDFDGVLVNTLNFSFAIHKNLNNDLTWEKFQDFSNGNFHDGIGKAMKEESYTIPNNWDELYDSNIKKLTISDVLNNSIKFLSQTNHLVVVSSSGSNSIANFLVKEKVREYFEDILGADVSRSKIVKINYVLEKYKIKPTDAVFITDSLGDILEGNKCGILSIGVTWGTHSRETLSKGNPVAIIDDPRDLVNIIVDVLK